MSVSQIRPGLFLSGLDSALNRSILSSRNVTLVVNASGLEGVSYPQLDGLQVLHVPVQDRPHAPLGHYFDLVSERINQNNTGTTLVHCTAGRSRSPALIMSVLINLRQAHELVLEQRQFVRPNAGFWRQLMDYERTRTGRSTVRMASTPRKVPARPLRSRSAASCAPATCEPQSLTESLRSQTL
uniref:Uncharacterized protein n=1 Tax=Labrus bergylta TaxID=56723 RepID=A0A3Q3F4F9_9LABR